MNQIANAKLTIDKTNFTNPLKKNRTLDDAITVKSDIGEKGAPKAGNYLVEDKAGAAAFKVDQAEDYSSALTQGNGIITTTDGKVYQGVVYFFSTKSEAEEAIKTINKLNNNIFVGFFNNQGELKWQPR